MGFGSDWLEAAYRRWTLNCARSGCRRVLVVVGASAMARALAAAPDPLCFRPLAVAICAFVTTMFSILRKEPEKIRITQAATMLILVADCILSMPGHDAVFPAIIAIFASYTLLHLPFFLLLGAMIMLSALQLSTFVLFVAPLKTNELLAIVAVHIWIHLIGIYLQASDDRLFRSTFLSGRNSVEAEQSADEQNLRLNSLLGSFLPSHLVSSARQQIALYNPHIYAEHYQQTTVAYGRLIGFESVLAQCSSLDAVRVMKEIDERIDRLAASNGCTRIGSEGILVVASIPTIDVDHANKICRFAIELEALINSFRDSTTADVSVCVGIDSGSISAGIVGSTKWHYDVIGVTVDNAILLQSNAVGRGVFLTEDAKRFVGHEFEVQPMGEYFRLVCNRLGSEMFPVQKRFSLVTVPQAINRLLQTISVIDPTVKTMAHTKKRKSAKLQEILDAVKSPSEKVSFMNEFTLQFKNAHMEEEYHKEMDHWFIPALAISIFFLVVYGIYHMLVMPRLIVSLILIVVALSIMFAILLFIYVNFFETFTQFITRTSAGHSVAILLILAVLFLCGIVNTFNCPKSAVDGVCSTAHFSTFSFALWVLTTAIFLRFSSFYLLFVFLFVCFTYVMQVFLNHPPIGPREFRVEFDLLAGLVSLCALVLLHSRKAERMMRLDFLSVVKGVEETSSRDRLALLNSQILLNLVPNHVAPWVVSRSGNVWHHTHHSVGVAYMAVSGFDLQGEQGMNGLNYIFSYFDQALANYKGIEKIKNANRFYIVSAGLLPDAVHNVDETPWTIGELLNTLVQFLIHVTEFATEKEFQIQIGVDCGSALTFVADPERPRYELWGETVERSRILMQSAHHENVLVSEEIFLALRPRALRFSKDYVRVMPNLNAYTIYCGEQVETATMPREEQERHTQGMLNSAMRASVPLDTVSSMASSFSSELHTIDDGGETDSDIEWITPETALMRQSMMSQQAPSSRFPIRQNYRNTEYDPYREPVNLNEHHRMMADYKADHMMQYSDVSDGEYSRGNSRSRRSSKGRHRWRDRSKSSLRNPFAFMRKSTSTDLESMGDPNERLEAAATRVDRMLQELSAYGNFNDVKPLEYRPFPTNFGSIKSINRAMSSACHTEYDNAESEGVLSEEENANGERSSRIREKRRREWKPREPVEEGDVISQCSSVTSSVDLGPLRWKSVHSIGYENEYELQSEGEGLAVEEMKALSRDIRKNFGDFQLSTFDDIDQD